jgi:hypothetical protein
MQRREFIAAAGTAAALASASKAFAQAAGGGPFFRIWNPAQPLPLSAPGRRRQPDLFTAPLMLVDRIGGMPLAVDDSRSAPIWLGDGWALRLAT